MEVDVVVGVIVITVVFVVVVVTVAVLPAAGAVRVNTVHRSPESSGGV